MLMADPNANESKTKTKTGRDSSRLKTRERALQNLYHRGVCVFWSRDRHTNAVCERMSLLRILTCFARVLRPDVTSWPTAGRWIQQLFVGNRSCVGIAWHTRGPKTYLITRAYSRRPIVLGPLTSVEWICQSSVAFLFAKVLAKL
jgi:hypothetical protein